MSAESKHILIVDDDKPVVRALAVRCQQLGLQVYEAYTAAEAMSILRRRRPPPDLMILDFALSGTDGLSLCDKIRADRSLTPLPVILLTAFDNPRTRRRCLESGTYFVLKDVNAWRVLEPLIRRLAGLPQDDEAAADPQRAAEAPATPPPATPCPSRRRILVIDDDPAVTKTLKIRLEAFGYSVFEAASGMEGYWIALRERPDLILLDFKMPEAQGNTILGKLKSNPITRDIKVVIISGMTDLGIQRDVLRLGADCWINKPFDMRQLLDIIKDKIPVTV